MATDEKVREVFGLLAGLYLPNPSKDQLALLLKVWRRVLADVPDGPLGQAAADYMGSDAEFMPKPGQLRARALELAGASREARALAAYGEIEACAYGRKECPDALVVEVVRLLGGFGRFGDADEYQADRLRREFLKLYAERAGANFPPLLGDGSQGL